MFYNCMSVCHQDIDVIIDVINKRFTLNVDELFFYEKLTIEYAKYKCLQ